MAFQGNLTIMWAIRTVEISTNVVAHLTTDALVATMDYISNIGRINGSAVEISLVTKLKNLVTKGNKESETKGLGTLPHKRSLIGIKKDCVLNVEELFILDINAHIDTKGL